tara:strand:+ start:4922 stop:5926 length:1005 start_codon:yes stop_codon:yes gene_type:complete
MTELELYIEDIKRILTNPKELGSNAIVPTQEQLNALATAGDRATAIKLVNDWGWNFANETWQLENDSEEIDITSESIQAMLSGANTGPGFLGVESYQPITYQGEAIEIGSVPGENFYMDGDQNFSFEGLMPDKIMDLQAEFINAGLLGPAVGIAFRPGVWQSGVEGLIMARLMGDSNLSGIGKAENGWENKLQQYIANPVSMPSQVQPYLPPDYRSVSNSIDGLFENDLGRKPKPYELKLLAETYLNESLSAYKQDVELGKPVQETVTPEMLADYGNHLQEPKIREETDIDPSAALLDTFDRITKTEQERLGKNRDIQAGNNLILNSIGGLERL